MEFITSNYEWIFGGIGVPVLIFLFKFLTSKKKDLNSSAAHPSSMSLAQFEKNKEPEREDFTKS